MFSKKLKARWPRINAKYFASTHSEFVLIREIRG